MDSSKVTVSPTIKIFSFKYTSSTSLLPFFEIKEATALLLDPIIVSPWIELRMLEFKFVKVIFGIEGSEVDDDSNTPKTDSTSQTFKEISSSSTLNP